MPPAMLLAVDRRVFAEPRAVEVQRDGRWWPRLQSAWRFDPERGWVAEVTFSMEHEWGRGNHVDAVPADRVRLPPSIEPGGEPPRGG